jgi:hypothetical protein
MQVKTITRWLTLAALLVILPAGVAQAQPAAVLKDIKVSFQVDLRVTQASYMGEKWVSPATYVKVQDGQKPLTVPAKAMGLDAKGSEVKINPAWKAGNTELVQVSPSQGNAVELTILKVGQSDLTVTSGGVSKKLTVKTVRRHGGLRVDISQ